MSTGPPSCSSARAGRCADVAAGTPEAPATPRGEVWATFGPRLRSTLSGAAGLLGVLALWWVAALTVFRDKLVPTPPAVVAKLVEDGASFYLTNFGATVEEALRGFLWGNVVALLLASLVLLVPLTERLVTQVAVHDNQAVKPGDLLLTLGAGDITTVGPAVLARLGAS